MGKRNGSGFELRYEFVYPGKTDNDVFYYEMSFHIVAEALRRFGDFNDVGLDGTDTNVWNLFANFPGAIEQIIEDDYIQEWLLQVCEEDAFEEYKEEYEDWYSDEEDEEDY